MKTYMIPTVEEVIFAAEAITDQEGGSGEYSGEGSGSDA